MLDQRTAFSERLKRIDKGKQFEPEGVIGRRAQKSYEKKYGTKAERNKRPMRNAILLAIAFAAGITSVLGGRLIYFHLSRFEGLPEGFYDLQGRGVFLIAAVLVATFVAIFGMYGRGKLPALALGCAAMYFGEAAVAANATNVWAQLFSPEYAADMAARGSDYTLTPAG